VVKTGTRCLPKHIRIPRSTVSTWRRRGSRPVVTIEQPDQDRQQLLDTITRLERQKRVLAAVVRILLSLLRAFGISLAGERLPEGDAKAGILRAIATSKPYIHAVIDNYSRKILAWMVAPRLEPTGTCQLLFAASKHIVCAGQPLVYVDSGIENVNSAVDAVLFTACLNRVLAQVDVGFSNSMIEAFWRSMKHQWLFLNSLDSIERLRVLIQFFVEQHNTKMPHPAFSGQTPDEMYFGTAVDLPTKLAAARSNARAERLAANWAMTCNQCSGQQASPPVVPNPP
jgi:transposase InsO family protein